MDTSSTEVLRILDANANRAAEGMRVVEDYARFVLDDGDLSSAWKQLRHQLADVVGGLPKLERYAARNAESDVGAAISTPQEGRRGDALAVAEASLKRVEQALRSLEEYGKILDVARAGEFERMRYRAYALARLVGRAAAVRQRLENVRLYVLIEGGDDPEEFDARARSLIAARVDALQLRDKRLDDRNLLKRARQLRSLTQSADTLFIVNDRPDLAALAHADGVHVGQEEISVKDARRIVGPRVLVGVSTHNLDQARQAVLDGADYIGCGPTFPSRTKEFDNYPGVDFLREVASEIQLPAFAIGGIDARRLGEVAEAGFARVAVSAAVTATADPARAAEELRRLLHAS